MLEMFLRPQAIFKKTKKKKVGTVAHLGPAPADKENH